MEKRILYQAPFARDISGLSAIGGKPKPMAMCKVGQVIVSKLCSVGTEVHSDTAGCTSGGGYDPTDPYCGGGNQPIQGCKSGGNYI